MDRASASSTPSFPTVKPTPSPDFVSLGEPPEGGFLAVLARLLGTRIDTRELAADIAVRQKTATTGMTIVFRHGVAVSFCTDLHATKAIDAAIARFVIEPVDVRETESANVTIQSEREDHVRPDGRIVLSDSSQERLLLVAIVLARSVVLSRDEILVSEAFDRSAPLVADLQDNGRARLPITSVMKLVGNVLAARHRVMHSVQAGERPDVLWDHPQLDRLYSRLEAEYELSERAEVLERKFEALGDFTSALLTIVQDKRAFRLEAAIIALIAFEILLTLLKMATG